jgi:hypothetical protein
MSRTHTFLESKGRLTKYSLCLILNERLNKKPKEALISMGRSDLKNWILFVTSLGASTNESICFKDHHHMLMAETNMKSNVTQC